MYIHLHLIQQQGKYLRGNPKESYFLFSLDFPLCTTLPYLFLVEPCFGLNGEKK